MRVFTKQKKKVKEIDFGDLIKLDGYSPIMRIQSLTYSFNRENPLTASIELVEVP